ncbi:MULTISPECIES: hypothetical protein [Enterobacter cloacae complex]|uniref:hypothetical protein n=1 Tax=Enterobacter cloacae complex TaxID=354276 RepID=UPI00079C83B9|nr:hypothetical protein [Enterobacter ludwigii]CZY11043.1 Uncharacterised protein [Enterobacter ludwigii]SAG97491.1 Uncharacterised protein [Enterobacter ludwigii]
MEKKFVNFGFTMSPEIPASTAHEIVALKNVIMCLLAHMPEKRKIITEELSAIDSDIMRDIVKNIRLMD